MTLYAYELNSVMAGMLAVLILVVVAFAWLLQREQRNTKHVDWLLAEVNAMRMELHRHGIEFVSMNPRNVAHVPFAQAVPDGDKPADNGTLTVAAAEEITVPMGALVFHRMRVSSDGVLYVNDRPIKSSGHIRPEPEGGE